MKILLAQKVKSLPPSPGVYILKDARGRFLYIGKASSLKTRVSSYFPQPQHGKIARMLEEARILTYKRTPSVIEALILEANLIKKYQPKYNVKLKDDKSFVEIIITKEEFPRIFVDRRSRAKEILYSYGPYTSAKSARRALEIIRKIFPFRSCRRLSEKGCLYWRIGLCPGPCIGKVTRSDYRKTIGQVRLILEGKKKKLIGLLKKEMASEARYQNFEKAARSRDKIFALEHIQDVALIGKESPNIGGRIEAYDVSCIGKILAVGSMVTFREGRPDLSGYRRFRIKLSQGKGDVAALEEILARRLAHKEWPLPDLIFVDGGKGQLNGALKVLEKARLKIPVVALAKGPKRKGTKVYASEKLKISKKNLCELSQEAHRFAISYHRLLRKKRLLKD